VSREHARKSLPQIRKPSLAWRRDGTGWLLLANRRRFGRVVPDVTHPTMWRSIKSDGQLSESANLSWAKNAVLLAAERELEFEHRSRPANDPSKCSEAGGDFSVAATPMRFSDRGRP
jgi:hypothetical protein